ncbi:MAG: hypothetical protein JXA46_10510 [Dehalococcoidales bacterium]|nr:hypothetical protein [Dehalococcoidales bacterium]
MKFLMALGGMAILVIGFFLIYHYVPGGKEELDRELENYGGTRILNNTTPSQQMQSQANNSQPAPSLSVTITALSADWDNMPVYPGARLSNQNSTSNGEERYYDVTADFESVVAWYQQEMSARGWEETKSSETPGKYIESVYAKGREEASVRITNNGDPQVLKLFEYTY